MYSQFPYIETWTSRSLLHNLQTLGNLERRLGLRLDLVDRHALGVLDQRQTVGEVDLENSLNGSRILSALLSAQIQARETCRGQKEWGEETHQLRDNQTNTCLASQREQALLQDLRVPLFIRVLHRDDDLGLGRVGDEIHGAAEALDLACRTFSVSAMPGKRVIERSCITHRATSSSPDLRAR